MMNDDTDTQNAANEACGIAEGIALRLHEITSGFRSDGGRTASEYRDMAYTLKDIEDRLYGTGEYAARPDPWANLDR